MAEVELQALSSCRLQRLCKVRAPGTSCLGQVELSTRRARGVWVSRRRRAHGTLGDRGRKYRLARAEGESMGKRSDIRMELRIVS